MQHKVGDQKKAEVGYRVDFLDGGMRAIGFVRAQQDEVTRGGEEGARVVEGVG